MTYLSTILGSISYRIWESVVIPACPDVGVRFGQLYQRWDKIRPLRPPNFLDKQQHLEWNAVENCWVLIVCLLCGRPDLFVAGLQSFEK
jgi:hypothetical protein